MELPELHAASMSQERWPAGWQGADVVQTCTEALLLQRAVCPCGYEAK